MVPTDLHISLSYLTAGELARIGESLRHDPDEAIDGWYVRAYSNEGYTDHRKYTRLTPKQAENVARAIDTALGWPGGGSITAQLRRVQAEVERRDRKRLETLPAQIERLQSEQARLERELSRLTSD